MHYNDGSRFECKLVDSNGEALNGEQITFIINGVIYNRLTNIDGIAKLNIRLLPSDYIITSQYGNEVITNNIIVNNMKVDPEIQEILDNLPFEIDPSLLPLLIGNNTNDEEY